MFQTKLVEIDIAGTPTLVPHYEAGAQGVYTSLANPDYIYNSTLQAGYQQLTDFAVIASLYLDNWGGSDTKEIYTEIDKTASKRIDWKFVRDYLKGLVSAIGFSNLSSEEQKIAAKYNIGTKQEQEAVLLANYTREERQSFSYNYDASVKVSRGVRVSEVIGALWQFTGHLIVPTTIFPVPAYILTSLISVVSAAPNELSGDLLDLFKFKGLQGIQVANDGILGIYDFILSTVGTRFETTGLGVNPALLGSGNPSSFADWTAFKDYIFNIIHNGNY